MKCTFKNPCERKEWCCNFCAVGCAVRCTDCHKDCQWFINEKIEEENDIQNK